MKWLTELEHYNMSFSIYILNTNDSIIFPHITDDNQIICVLDGFMQILKVFTNGEKICTKLLYKNNALTDIKFHVNRKTTYYYKAIAITKTAIVTIPTKELDTKIKRHFLKILSNFEMIYQNHDIIHILSYKNTKQRLVQFLLILIKNFGQINQNFIIIPFYISHNTIANITGSQRITINRIMSTFKQNQIIHYDNQRIIIYSILQLIQK